MQKEMIGRRIGTMLLILLLMVMMIPSVAFAAPEQPEGNWADYTESSFAGGSGTKEDPYQIATAGQLAKLAADINSGVVSVNYSGEYFRLTKDIDLSEHAWTPIGIGENGNGKAFSGYFDGDGHSITGLYISEDDTVSGLFGRIVTPNAASDVLVKNLTIQDAYVKNVADTFYTGILAGSITNQGAKVSNCHVSGTVEGYQTAGGLVGYSSYGEYEDCSTDVKVSVVDGMAGGMIGEAFACQFTNCSSEGSVSGGWNIGGFAGLLWYDSSADYCISDTEVQANDWQVGGFAGYVEVNTSISNCVVFGNVSSTLNHNTPKVGGFAGMIDGSNRPVTITDSHFAGTMSVVNISVSGGFLGADNGGTVKGCSYDGDRNPDLAGVGTSDSSVLQDITKGTTQEVLSNICEDYYGGHDYSTEWTVDQAATCTEAGSQSHHCVRCDAKGTTEEIPALGHDLIHHEAKAPTCTEAGWDAYDTCSRCDYSTYAEIAAAGHQFEDGKCTVCGVEDPDYKEDIQIDKTLSNTENTDKVSTPRTGDETPVALWIGILIVACVLVVGILIYRKKHKDE